MRRTEQEEMDIGNHFFLSQQMPINAGLFLLSPALTSETSFAGAMQTSASSPLHITSYV
jgi:hypothetical protein